MSRPRSNAARNSAARFPIGIWHWTSGVVSVGSPRHWGITSTRYVGLDISPTMISVASRLNRHGSRVSYRLNESNRLEGVGTDSITLVFSHITLQHVPSDLARSYLGEFLRVVKPGGIVIAQLPSHYATSYLPADRDDLPVAIEVGGCRSHFRYILGRCWPGRPSSWRSMSPTPVTRPGRRARPILSTSAITGSTAERGTVSWDDGRARLPGRMQPGETVRITLSVTAPVKAGAYVLWADIAQEGAFWFSDSGLETDESALLELSVVVEPGTPVPQGEGDAGLFRIAGDEFRRLGQRRAPHTPAVRDERGRPR